MRFSKEQPSSPNRKGVTAYASSVAFFGHAVGEDKRDLQALISAATEFQGSGDSCPYSQRRAVSLVS